MPSDNKDSGRLDQVERTQKILERDLRQLRRELQAHGLRIPEPNPGGRTKLSPEARQALLRRAAAKARAAKQVGPGVGGVNDEETASRLRQEALELLAQADETDDQEPQEGP
jgi:sugar phosphate isomerase/epimerase